MAPDRIEIVTHRGYFSRVANSFAGILIGFILILAAIGLLWWNEGRAVQAERGLAEARGAVVDAPLERIDPALEGKLVHLSGEAQSATPRRDDATGLTFADTLVLTRQVEMYQWTEKKQTRTEDQLGGGQREVTTYTYSKDWSERKHDSAAFHDPTGHQNPPMDLRTEYFAAGDAALGVYRLNREQLLRLTEAKKMPITAAPQGWRSEGQGLYRGRGTAANPEIGDTRLFYVAVPSPAPVSLLAKQSADGFSPYEAKNGYLIDLVRDGRIDAERMIQDRQGEETTLTWILRAAGLLAMWIGFCLIMGPLQALSAIIPFLSNVVGFAIALIALALTLPLGLSTIALAWLFYRPLLSLGLIALGLAAAYGLIQWRKRMSPPAAAQSAPA